MNGRDRADYDQRLAREQEIYKDVTDVHALPEIFHYWSNTYVRPMLDEVGASDPDQFFAECLRKSALRVGAAHPKFISLGAGNCDTEVRVARRIRELGIQQFTIECLDINDAMLERGAASAAAEGVARHIVPRRADFNEWSPQREYAGVMANQSLHHMLELGKVFDAVNSALMPHALFVISDMIGRNGHQRWPEALAAVHRFWQELPDAYRYNQQLKRAEPMYENWDCSTEGFEGIRAQDILPLLLERFHFEVFIAFGNVIDVFVDRSFGHNFSRDGEWDRAFVDRVHAFDEAGFQDRSLTPTHLIAALSREPPLRPFRSRGLDPAACVHR